MYSMVLMVALTGAPADLAAFGGRCAGRGSYACAGYGCAGACYGCACYGWTSCHGTCGCHNQYRCHGGGGCSGAYQGYGCFGCYGSCHGSYTNWFGYGGHCYGGNSPYSPIDYGTSHAPVHYAPVHSAPMYAPAEGAPVAHPPAGIEPVGEPKKMPGAPEPAKKDTPKIGRGAAPAQVIVSIPADAKLLANGHATKLTGERREFATPVLVAGQTYHYVFTAEAVRGGQPVVETRRVTVSAGATVNVDFGSLAATTVAAR